jgi:hypothetical protein
MEFADVRFPAAVASKWTGTACSKGGPRRPPDGNSSAKFNNKFNERHEGFGLAREMSGGDAR